MPCCMSVCTCQGDLYYAIYFHISLHFNSFIITTSIKCNRLTESLPLRRIVTVKVTYNSVTASRPRCRLIAPSVYVNWRIVYLIFSHKPLFHLFYHYLSIKIKGVSIYLLLRSIIAIELTYTIISAGRARCRVACLSCTSQGVLLYATNFPINRPFNLLIITTSIKCNRITVS